MGIVRPFVYLLSLGFLIFTLSACSTVGTVQKTDEPGKYTISVSSNAFSTKSKREAKFLSKAKKVCNSSNYEFIGTPKSEVQKIKDYSRTPPTTVHVLVENRMLICKDIYQSDLSQ